METKYTGTLTKAQLSLVVSLCDLAGKIQGVQSYPQLGALLSAIEAFQPQQNADEANKPAETEAEKGKSND